MRFRFFAMSFLLLILGVACGFGGQATDPSRVYSTGYPTIPSTRNHTPVVMPPTADRSSSEAYVFFAPVIESPLNPDQMSHAVEVLQYRLDHYSWMKGGGTASIEDENVRVDLTESQDLPIVIALGQKAGKTLFIDSETPIPEGAVLSMKNQQVILSDLDIQDAEITKNANGHWQIGITLTEEGREILAEYSSQNIGHFLVILSDDTVIAAPLVREPLSDGFAIISESATQNAMHELYYQIVGGSLPFPLKMISFKKDVQQP